MAIVGNSIIGFLNYFRLFIVSGYCWQLYHGLLFIILGYLSLVAIVGNSIIGCFFIILGSLSLVAIVGNYIIGFFYYVTLFIMSGYYWQFYHKLLLINLGYLSLMVIIVGNSIIGFFLSF